MYIYLFINGVFIIYNVITFCYIQKYIQLFKILEMTTVNPTVSIANRKIYFRNYIP